MNKKVKFLIILIILIAIIAVLAICLPKNSKENNNNIDNPDNNITNNESENSDNTLENDNINPKQDIKSKSIFNTFSTNKFLIKYSTVLPNDLGQLVEANVLTAIDGNNLFIDIPELNTATLIKGDKMYNIIHDTKQYIVMDKSQAGNTNNLAFVQTPEDISSSLINTGTENVKGFDYYFEEFAINDIKEKIYFKDNVIKYIKITNSETELTLEITEFTNNVDSSYFNLPAGYTALSF